MAGADSFFGGLAEGLGQGILQREQTAAQERVRTSEQRRSLWQLLNDNPDVPDDLKAYFGEILFQPPPQEPGVGGAIKRVARGAPKQIDPIPQIFKVLNEYHRTGKKPLPPVPHGAANAPLQTETIGPSGGAPPTVGPIPELQSSMTTRQREAQARLGEYQGQADIQTRAGEERKRLEDERLERQGRAIGLEGRDLAEWIARRNLFGGMQGRFVTKALGSGLPQNAIDTEGKPIPAELRTAEHVFSGVPVGVDSQGNPQYQWVETVPGQGESPSTDIKNYKFAVSQGYKGTFEQWQREQANLRPRDVGVTVITPGEGGGGKVTRLRPGDIAPAGTVTPQQFGSTQVPTAATRTRSEFAEGLIPEIQTARQMVMQNRDLLGPAAGRFNARFLAGMVGSTGDPQKDARLGALRARIGLLQTGMMVPHVGARGGQNLIKKFTDQVNEGTMTAEMLNAALGEWEIFLKRYAGEGRIRGWGGLSPNTTDEPIPTKPVKTANDLKAKYGIK